MLAKPQSTATLNKLNISFLIWLRRKTTENHQGRQKREKINKKDKFGLSEREEPKNGKEKSKERNSIKGNSVRLQGVSRAPLDRIYDQTIAFDT